MKKIVVIGPESTGKSTLCEFLANHYKTSWVPEYAREFLLKNGPGYNYDDLLTIARGQLSLEDEMAKKETGPFLFVDTDMYVMKVWCEFVFEKCHDFILNEIVNRKYDLYLLCKTDLPWVQDELREYPDLCSRELLYQIYHDQLINQNVPWVEIGGSYEERFKGAIRAIDSLK